MGEGYDLWCYYDNDPQPYFSGYHEDLKSVQAFKKKLESTLPVDVKAAWKCFKLEEVSLD